MRVLLVLNSESETITLLYAPRPILFSYWRLLFAHIEAPVLMPPVVCSDPFSPLSILLFTVHSSLHTVSLRPLPPFPSFRLPLPVLPLCIFFRALTFQRVSSWRVDQDVVARVSSDSMFVRDVCVAQSPLRLGDLSGNFFAITLRKEEGSNTQNSLTITGQPSASSLLSSFAAVASYPFMNIFGVQRFGSPLPSNPEVGMRLLASDYRGTCVCMYMRYFSFCLFLSFFALSRTYLLYHDTEVYCIA